MSGHSGSGSPTLRNLACPSRPPPENQPHHAGAALVWGPDGELLAQTQETQIREEMIVTTLDAKLLARERSLANYMLRTRRPELFDELVRDQVSS
jgi:predicted amidohydrolase